MPVLIKIRPALLIAVAAALAALTVFAMQGHRPAASPSSPAPVGALQVSTAPAAGLTTRQLVDRYTAAVKAAPTAVAYDNLALAELQLAREDADPTWYGKAQILFNRALALDPKNFEALGGLGSLAASRHDFTAALALSRRSLSIDPQSGYAAEAIGPWLGDRGSRLERVAVAAAGLQDLLGAMHDAVVSRSDLEASLGEAHDSEYAYMAGRLVERLCASASERRRRYPKAWRRVARRWRKA